MPEKCNPRPCDKIHFAYPTRFRRFVLYSSSHGLSLRLGSIYCCSRFGCQCCCWCCWDFLWSQVAFDLKNSELDPTGFRQQAMSGLGQPKVLVGLRAAYQYHEAWRGWSMRQTRPRAPPPDIFAYCVRLQVNSNVMGFHRQGRRVEARYCAMECLRNAE